MPSYHTSGPSTTTKASGNMETDPPPLRRRYVEFYSGIGGWSLALDLACRAIERGDTTHPRRMRVEVQRVASYDHSDLCNAVFAHNFIDVGAGGEGAMGTDKSVSRREKRKRKRGPPPGGRPPQATSLPSYPIEKLSRKVLADLNADIWVMSPPCQPHTRQHSNHAVEEELSDPRSRSFLHLLGLLDEMAAEDANGDSGSSSLPKLILLENVVGFESSASCARYMSALRRHGYSAEAFHLTPSHLGLPNDRPRYYSVAVRSLKASVGGASAEGGGTGPPPLLPAGMHDGGAIRTSIPSPGASGLPSSSSHPPTIASYLDADLPPLALGPDSVDQIKLGTLQIPKSTIAKSASWCFDVITKVAKRSACFTSSYGRFAKGTGSVLYYGGVGAKPRSSGEGKKNVGSDLRSRDDVTQSFRLIAPSERSFDAKWWESLVLKDGDEPPLLRYLSGTEVARLMGFPIGNKSEEACFSFPDWCTQKQQWRLLGNSINVVVSAEVAKIGIRACLLEE